MSGQGKEVKEKLPETATVATENPQPQTKQTQAVKQMQLSAYLGPTIKDVILSGTVFSKDRSAVLGEMADAVDKYPLIADLIVRGEDLQESRRRLRVPGSLLRSRYDRLLKDPQSVQFVKAKNLSKERGVK